MLFHCPAQKRGSWEDPTGEAEEAPIAPRRQFECPVLKSTGKIHKLKQQSMRVEPNLKGQLYLAVLLCKL